MHTVNVQFFSVVKASCVSGPTRLKLGSRFREALWFQPSLQGWACDCVRRVSHSASMLFGIWTIVRRGLSSFWIVSPQHAHLEWWVAFFPDMQRDTKNDVNGKSGVKPREGERSRHGDFIEGPGFSHALCPSLDFQVHEPINSFSPKGFLSLLFKKVEYSW